MPCLAARALAPALLSLAVLASPVRAGVSPFAPIDLGTVPAGSVGQYDVVLPLTLPFTSIPASFDAVVLYTAADGTEAAALALLGFASPVTVGQVKAQMPTAAIQITGPTMAISAITGNLGLASLGCTATDCSWRVNWDLPAPGTFGAHLEVQVASVAILNGGLLGSFLTLLYPLVANFVGGYLHYDVVVRAAAAPAAPAVPVPATGDAALAALAMALAGLAARAFARRRRGGR
jgi:hypothetical protein